MRRKVNERNSVGASFTSRHIGKSISKVSGAARTVF